MGLQAALDRANEEYSIRLLICCAVFLVAIIAVTKAILNKTGDKKCKSMYIGKGVVELLSAFMMVIVMGDGFTSYWDGFNADYLELFIETSLPCFIGGIVMTVWFIVGIIDLVRGLLKKN